MSGEVRRIVSDEAGMSLVRLATLAAGFIDAIDPDEETPAETDAATLRQIADAMDKMDAAVDRYLDSHGSGRRSGNLWQLALRRAADRLDALDRAMAELEER